MELKDYYYLDSIKRISDKGWCHAYIENYYTNKFSSLKDKQITMLEIGVLYGQSTRLWTEWFSNIFIYGIDISEQSIESMSSLSNTNGIVGDGYTIEMLKRFKDESFDIIIEDGPHTIETQMFAAINWTKKLKKGGFMIIEDIQDISHAKKLIESLPQGLAYQYFDLRHVKNRYDDLLLEITKL